jgi:hypothetical protein
VYKSQKKKVFTLLYAALLLIPLASYSFCLGQAQTQNNACSYNGALTLEITYTTTGNEGIPLQTLTTQLDLTVPFSDFAIQRGEFGFISGSAEYNLTGTYTFTWSVVPPTQIITIQDATSLIGWTYNLTATKSPASGTQTGNIIIGMTAEPTATGGLAFVLNQCSTLQPINLTDHAYGWTGRNVGSGIQVDNYYSSTLDPAAGLNQYVAYSQNLAVYPKTDNPFLNEQNLQFNGTMTQTEYNTFAGNLNLKLQSLFTLPPIETPTPTPSETTETPTPNPTPSPASTPTPTPQPQNTVTVTALSGNATIQRTGSTTKEPAHIGSILYPGDTFSTGSNGFAALTFSDSAEIRLGYNSAFTLEAPPDGSQTKDVSPLNGIIHFLESLRQVGHGFRVHYENIVISVRGTEFAVQTSQDQSVDITVIDGAVNVEDNRTGNNITLEAGQAITIPSSTTQLTQQQMEQCAKTVDLSSVDKWWMQTPQPTSTPLSPFLLDLRAVGGIVGAVIVVIVVAASLALRKRKRRQTMPYLPPPPPP